MSEQEIMRDLEELKKDVEEARQSLKDKSHQELVNYVRKIVALEGLLTYKAQGSFSEGFTPDVITNVDGTTKGWVLIDVINRQESILYDIAGLLVVKANVEDKGDKIKAILCAASHNVDGIAPMQNFLRQYPQVICFRIDEFRPFLRMLKKGAI